MRLQSQSLRARTVAGILAGVLILMSACLLLQWTAAPEKIHSCHDTPGENPDRQPLAMERCCHPGILKSTDKFVAIFEIAEILPIFNYSNRTHLSFSVIAQGIVLIPTSSSERLAELSLLRI